MSIAIDAGFGSKATFNRVFKERFGMTPSAFRRVSKNKKDHAKDKFQRIA
ncbi:helix-turn-helix domain-containing protein [Polymorphobacter multimanifer]|uniref:AraC-like DNA-binding protein n=1 Tax=Polymorphobacter multimanifer TaxID=1070431 RepID=A0A841L5E3_9SPHN|nr:helix-turn-helix domain-containing protein [Polymorphobacter multimanifer]MBB6227486.1 AraC-like DNA-binding protein [Polymorphobacter multimanifer]